MIWILAGICIAGLYLLLWALCVVAKEADERAEAALKHDEDVVLFI